ncbi:aspartate--tRNA(Asn) ligase [Candidatus Saccharibacteria bacterium]|nr:aspartate--tRNA(Asn) ligase [Candidatus Saccharibacteria bacterium]HOR23366.1 aspartate--tRNA(Asn) ligase [Candidatus Saccharibacteria bacterium]HPW47818.1 aspartate--tRNA(Asn) ligase [Candidatus Saccharibacteria bacterium]
MRVLSSDIKKHAGKTIEARGWLHKKRLLGGLTFINVRDRQGIIQVLVEERKEVEKLRGMQIGTVIAVKGVVVKDERAPGGAEIHQAVISIIVPVSETSPIEIDKAISHKSDNLDTLFEYRALSLRNPKESAIFKIQAVILESIRTSLEKQQFTEFNSPKLLAEATEGGAEVFKLDYFGKEATLAQSAQFYKQIMVGVYERVFEINPTYRAELSATTRHMTEFIQVDVEAGFIEFSDLLQISSNVIHAAVSAVWSKCQDQLKLWGATKPRLPKILPTITLNEVHEKYSKATKQSTIGEEDLRPDEERWITDWSAKELDSEAIFVVDWPASGAKFYHRLKQDDPKTAERADLIFRGVEIATASMREHRYDKLISQFKKAGIDYNHPGFKHYLMAFKYGLPPHGGFGLGLERLTSKIVGLANVKEASLFPRDINRLMP